jgi:hypothetical protein
MSDIIIQPINKLTINATINSKPIYAILFNGKSKKIFLTVDKPDLQMSYVSARGIFIEKTEEEILNNFTEILTNISKDDIVEMMFPWTKICSIRNLVFKSK